MSGGKAQAAVEFMICVLFLIGIMIFFTVYSGSKESERANVESKLEAEKICWQISNLINTAMYSRGYYAEFSLPKKIDGTEYELSITNKTVTVDYRGHSCIYQIAVTNISFSSQEVYNNISSCGGDFYINNTNDQIFISNKSAMWCA